MTTFCNGKRRTKWCAAKNGSRPIWYLHFKTMWSLHLLVHPFLISKNTGVALFCWGTKEKSWLVLRYKSVQLALYCAMVGRTLSVCLDTNIASKSCVWIMVAWSNWCWKFAIPSRGFRATSTSCACNDAWNNPVCCIEKRFTTIVSTHYLRKTFFWHSGKGVYCELVQPQWKVWKEFVS